MNRSKFNTVVVRTLLIAAVFGMAVNQATATITTVAWYHGGELDPGASIGSAVSPSMIDSSGGGFNMTPSGSPQWTATGVPGSLMAYQFNGANDGFVGGLATLSTNNVGMEAWVRSGNTADSTAFYSGNSGWDGYGLIQYSGAWHGLLGSVGLIGSAPIATGVWQHLALVEDNGVATFYVNGISAGTGTVYPYAPTVGMSLGARPNLTDFFAGAVDEARIFTFAPGQFSVNDLLVNGGPFVPEPSSVTLLALGGLLAWRRRK